MGSDWDDDERNTKVFMKSDTCGASHNRESIFDQLKNDNKRDNYKEKEIEYVEYHYHYETAPPVKKQKTEEVVYDSELNAHLANNNKFADS
jgi:hypothetical protein